MPNKEYLRVIFLLKVSKIALYQSDNQELSQVAKENSFQNSTGKAVAGNSIK